MKKLAILIIASWWILCAMTCRIYFVEIHAQDSTQVDFEVMLEGLEIPKNINASPEIDIDPNLIP